MSDINVRSDSVNVEQIMEQIRARIREKRGADYTEQQIQELANVKLEKFLDPGGVRSDLLEQFRRAQPPYSPPELPNYAFEDQTLFESHRAPLRWIRRVLRPLLKFLFNPNPLIQALNIQSRLNTTFAEREAKREAARHAFDQLHYEVMHNLVVETTRLGIEVKNLKMRVESLTSRLDFNERRARALESVVAYKPADVRFEPPQVESRAEPTAAAPGTERSPAAPSSAAPEGPGQKSRRRRRRRGRRGGGSVAATMGDPAAEQRGASDDNAVQGADDSGDASTEPDDFAAEPVSDRESSEGASSRTESPVERDDSESPDRES